MAKDKASIRARDLDILKQLRKGKRPATVIEYVKDEYELSHSTAYEVVYDLNHKLKLSTQELAAEAAEYIIATLINEIEDCADENDRKNKLKAIELLAKTCKVGESDNKVDLNVKFDFDTGEECQETAI